MKNIFAILLTLFVYAQASSTNNTNTFGPELIEIKADSDEISYGEILCVVNKGYSRKTIYLWFKGEIVSKISVAGNGEGCFEIGDYESAWQWKASEGRNGSKKGFYSGEATFY